MTKIIINDMELNVEKYNRDYIRSEISNKRLLRIKCETIIKGRDESEKLRGLLANKSFAVNIPSESIEFKGREGEISYHYMMDDISKGDDVEYNHVIEIIEFEDIPKEMLSDEIGLKDIDLLRKRVLILEELLISKGIINKEEIEELLKGKFNI